MFRKALIANRGEIACRVMRAARQLGLATVAVYSDADRDALHVRRADEAWPIGPAPAKDSYLSIEKILDVARRSEAEAVHPGYGFLSECADFSERCQQAGLAFVGPSAAAMRAVGGKAEAKKLMARIGVPTLPGFHGEKQDAQTFLEAAESIGFPVVIKASAGGGGRGMRVVASAQDLAPAMASARREALLAFGDDRLLIEKYLDRPRHLEVQILADAFGDVATFVERDCSLQRHHQKLIEETPAPGVSQKLRRSLCDAATEIARAAGYAGAGTVEFLVKDEAFFFLEVNARLQVEHPVTEMVSGVDLVEWQFRIAAGERLPAMQDRIGARGCAIEARICAEDPDEDFRPSSGVIAHLAFPCASDKVRVETGVQTGDAVPPFYDSLLAKLIVHGETREEAVRQLQRRLEEVELVGVANNISFLQGLIASSAFQAGGADTGLLGRIAHAPGEGGLGDEWLLAAAVAAWRCKGVHATRMAGVDPWSPWAAADSWRLYGASRTEVSFRRGGAVLACRFHAVDDRHFSMQALGRDWFVFAVMEGDRLALSLDGLRRELTIVVRGNEYVVVDRGRNVRLEWMDPLEPPRRDSDRAKSFLAPLPARVTRIFVSKGDHVARGAPILVLEAMKMEIPMNSPQTGVIEAVLCAEGQSVQEGEQLVAMAPP
ncbi:MAG: acetyl/propionyl/methylcrotonyl-CoA carboxylase subunit alpha [Methylocystis sp.]|uniref:acetyl/propionyl/methylcrotonyl-CoA carboxylase subunit alpha n=1 Tax=Methylocystis sp. TaxID=1911079 RepID=UPI003DA51581